MDQSRVSEVVQTIRAEDQRSSLEPWDVSGLGKDLRDNASESSQHSPSSVDELCSNSQSHTHILFFFAINTQDSSC